MADFAAERVPGQQLTGRGNGRLDAARMVIFFLFVFCTACAPLRRQVVAPPAVSRAEVTAKLTAATQFSTLKSLSKVEVDYEERGKLRKHSFDGALLHRSSGEFRLQGFGFMGKKVFDMLYAGDALTIYVPSSGLAYEGIAAAPEASNELEVFVVLRRAIMDTTERYAEARLEWKPDDPLHPWINEGNGRFVVLEVNPVTFAVDKKTLFENGAAVATISYENYQEVEGRFFPFRIGVSFPKNSLSVVVSFDTLTFDQPIPDNRFSLILPPRTARLPLSKLNLGFLTNTLAEE